MRHHTLEHRFVRNVPRELESGVLFISMEYATAVHSCCCGCGERVVTPFTPTDWHMTFNGESVSLHPSVGNWNQKCRSHYVIRQGRVLEAGPWSNAQVEAEHRRDKKAKAAHYGGSGEMRSTVQQPTILASEPEVAYQERESRSQSLWSRLKNWLGH
jgi:hypothetical protein